MRRAGWIVAGWTAAAAAAATVALWPAVDSIAGNWLAIHDYRHGFVIAPVALAWLLVSVHRLRGVELRASSAGCALLAAALFVWLVAWRAHSDIAIEALFPPVVWLSIWAAAGRVVAREAIAPLAYLYFAIPVWEFLLPTLQALAVRVTETTLALAGVPAEVSEYQVTLPAGQFEIVEGCSGKRYFVVALAVAVIAGVLQRLSGWRLAAAVAAGGLMALAANWLRILVVIYAGHMSGMQHYLVAVEHQTFGNVIFAMLLAGIYVVSRLLVPPAPAKAGGRADPEPAATGIPKAAGVPLAMLVAVAALVHAPQAQARPDPGALGPLPLATGRWQGPMPPAPGWSPRFAEPDGERRASYRGADGRSVEVYVNLYLAQRAGRELVYFENTLLAPGSWSQAWPARIRRIEAAGAPAMAALESRSPRGVRWLQTYVYRVGSWTTARPALAQASYGLQSLMRPAPAGIVSLSVQCGQNCEQAQALVRDFWGDMSDSLLGMLPGDAG